MGLWRRWGFRQRSLLLAGVSVLAMVSAFGLLGMAALNESTERIFQERLTLARLAADNLDRLLEKAIQQLEASTPLYPDPGGPLSEADLLSDVSLRFPIPSHYVSLTDQHGVVRLSRPTLPGLNGTDLSPLIHFEGASTGARSRVQVTDTFYDSVLGKLVVYMVSPLPGQGGEIAGAVVVALDLSHPAMQRLIYPTDSGTSAYTEVFDSKGMALATTMGERSLGERAHSAWFATMVAAGNATVATCPDCYAPGGGQRREIITFAPLANAPWALAIRQSEDEALAPIRDLQRQLLALGTLCLLIVSAAVWVATESVVRPVKALTASSSSIAQGNLARPITAQGPGEIGKLAQTLETMRIKLQEYLQEIASQTRELRESERRLFTSRNHLQAIMDSVEVALMVVDRDYCITQVNATFLRQYPEIASPIGKHCYEITHGSSQPCAPPQCHCPARQVWQTGHPARASHLHQTRGMEGMVERIVEVSASPLTDSLGRITAVVELMWDVTEQKRLEQRIRQAYQELYALNAVSYTMSQSLDLDTILNSALDRILELMKVDTGGILLLDEASQTLSYRAYRGLSQRFVQGIAKLKMGEGIAGKVAETGQPIVVSDITKDSRVTRPVVGEEGLRAFASVPLRSKDKVVGVLNIASRTPHPFTPQEVQLLTAVGNQMGVAVENARLYDEVQHREEVRSELLRQVIAAQEEERKRIARELHDETAQSLAALALSLATLASSAELSLEQVKAKLKETEALALQTLEETRRLMLDLRPSVLDDLGLMAALEWYAGERLEAAGVKVFIETVGQERKLPPEVESTFFRVLQEAISNIARHAQAQSVNISLDFRDHKMTARIEDDGLGFEAAEVLGSPHPQRSLGLVGMRERVELMGGVLRVRSQPGAGTEIEVEIPIRGLEDHG